MIAHKHTARVVAVVMALAVLLCLGAVLFSGSAAAAQNGVTMEYETALFDPDTVLSVNILMDEEEWNEMLENAISEEYYPCDVEINGETFYRVGIRPKGNTSLSSIANDPTTDRYSFKLEFDQYVDGQTCHGLDKLVLNNNYADTTNMKEALVYDMFRFLGADASLYNYAKISVNGEYWGVYLALEAVEDSFLLRNYGVSSGELYKPEGMNIGGGGGGNALDMGNMDFGKLDFGNMDLENMDFSPFSPQENADGTAPQQPTGQMPDLSNMDEMPDTTDMPDMSNMGDMPSMGEMPDLFNMDEMPDISGFGGFSSGGADLNYSDDELDSYSTIWDGEVTKTNDADHKRVVAALKSISEGSDLESAMDIDNLLRYMAVHIFSVNEDSLSGSMAHNYYLYEDDGRLNLLPWDYNLAFGGMGGGKDASSVVNSAIDDAFSATSFFDTLLADEEYHSRYYDFLRRLVDEYVDGGGLDAFYTRVRSQIDALVETDPNAFYSYEAYQTAAETLYQLVKLRASSIRGQLDGTIPSTESAQRGADTLIDASSIDLSLLGSMNTGGGFDRQDFDAANTSDTAAPQRLDGQSADDKTDTMPQRPDGQSTDGQTDAAPQRPDGQSADGQTDAIPAFGRGGGGGGGFDGARPDGGASRAGGSSALRALILYAASLLVLAAALLFAARYRRRVRK